jgi:hypothetical protein|tara:strand:+ start:96 stop:287 length:192 start_codon:yes stop_codon:yes gene_type:complete
MEDKAQQALHKMEVHEAECALRYKRIEERLEQGSKRFDRLERLSWSVIILLIGSLLIPIYLGV